MYAYGLGVGWGTTCRPVRGETSMPGVYPGAHPLVGHMAEIFHTPPSMAWGAEVERPIESDKGWSGRLEGEPVSFPAEPEACVGLSGVRDGGASRTGPRPIWRL